MFDFTIKRLDNIKFNVNELIGYFNKIESDYQHLCWRAKDSNIDRMTHKIEGVYSWAIQTNLKDINKPCPPYHIEHGDEISDNNNFDTPTDLIFGFGQKIIDTFPRVRQTVISCHPPNTFIDTHTDNDEFIKIHIPIKANNNSYFIFGEEKHNLQVGHAYLVNTTLPHSTNNLGDSDRCHLIFKIHPEDIDNIINNEHILDDRLFDFDILELPNFKFDLNELRDYYNMVTKSNLRFELPAIDKNNDIRNYPPNYEYSVGIFGYGIQSNLDDVTKPLEPPGNYKQKSKNKKSINRTVLCTGFAQKILDIFPYCEELGITGHPSKTQLHPHIDKDVHFRIHLPIYTNDNAEFNYDKTYILEAGKAYLVNTKRTHSTNNKGDSDRIHLMFKVPIGHVNKIIHSTYNLLNNSQ